MGWMAGVLLAKEEGGFLSVLSSVCVGVVLLLPVCCVRCFFFLLVGLLAAVGCGRAGVCGVVR